MQLYGTMEDPGDYVRGIDFARTAVGDFVGGSDGWLCRRASGRKHGALEILPEYRRKRYGFRLEAFLIRHFLEHGKLPFCQVIEGNTESMSLQKKLGMEISEQPTWWLFN